MNRNFHLTILGSNSAVPAYGRFPTSQVLRIHDHLFLIDCGEGTQIRMGQYRIKRNNIEHIFISHMHGDHLYGLPGLITSMSLNGRSHPLRIYGPPGIREYLDTVFRLSYAYLQFELQIIEFEADALHVLLDANDVRVSAFPVSHRVTCHGFLFEEKLPEKNLRKDKLKQYRLTIEEMKLVKKGGDIIREGVTISNKELTHETAEALSYAFCADSLPDRKILEYIKSVSALYFETTYLDDMSGQAHERGHSTVSQAAQIASEAGAGLLITGHYSSRYRELEVFKEEAEKIFNPVILGHDGEMVDINGLMNRLH